MLNQVCLVGRLTQTPELKTMNNAKQTLVTYFSIACQRDNDRDTADFIDCVCFNQQAENLCRYLRKGDMITIHGRLQTSVYTDRNNVKRKRTELVTDKIYYPEKKNTNYENYSNDVAIPLPTEEYPY